MHSIEKIYEDIIKDPMNKDFTKQNKKPIFMAHTNAKILIIGQAPGLKTQEREIVFKDKSGDTLRNWLGIDDELFYHSGLIAVLPLDFYYPGKGKTGDLPPRKQFAPKWHPPLISLMPNIELVILIGNYAQKYYLRNKVKRTLTQTVNAYEEYLPKYFVLVHPSPLNFRWFTKNPSFKEKTIPVLRGMVNDIITHSTKF